MIGLSLDETVFRVLEKLLIFKRQRLSYRALEVEQIGSVYEALMGYHVKRLPAPAVCLKPNRVWITVEEALAEAPATRTRWLQETTGLSKAQAEKLNRALSAAKRDDAALAVLEEVGFARADAGRLVIQPGAERRRTSSHYTPRSLTTPIVERTLEPLLAAMGPTPPSERIANLKICDPAMGSGAFLVEACRFLADQLVLAWTREGRHDLLAGKEDATLLARRIVAQRCLYGVDKNPLAVNLAKLSLWLTTLARDLPFTFLDHALRHGDSLVGLSFDQITAFHWKPKKQVDLCRKELEEILQEAIVARQRILDLAGDSSPVAQKERELSLKDAEDALDRVRLIGDLVVGAYFSATKDKDREAERDRLLNEVLHWLAGGGPAPEDLKDRQREIRARIPVLHWMAEVPEVFWTQRPDPLDADRTTGKAWIDAFVGNPPFMGKNGIAEMGGDAYMDWLKVIHVGAHGNADYSAHFFRRASDLLGDHGTIGLLATNTIAQGDTRATGLQHLVGEGLAIYDATRSMPWPGDAAVSVAVVHLGKGRLTDLGTTCALDGEPVATINSRLRTGAERPEPVPLAANANLSFQGSIVLGMGFVLTPEERNALVKKNKKNANRIFPYIGGEEVNTSPTQDFDRYVINLGEMSLDEASRWPDLIEIVRAKVKPERDKQKDAQGKKYWWRFLRPRPELAAALTGRKRCLVLSIVTKHLGFSFQPTDRVFAHRLQVFVLGEFHPFAVLQSRLHERWARLLSSTLEDRINYTATDCFENFPFPEGEALAGLEDIGRRLYEARAEYMVRTQQGLTQTYNRLKDPENTDPDIETLRALHVEMDRQVLAAYGWSDIPVPPYTTTGKPLAPFEDAIIDRLFALNAKRAEQERILGQGAKTPKTKRGTSRTSPNLQLPLAADADSGDE